MAIIRTQLVSGQRRIITKVVNGVRRVSCSCCEEPECCMYPADQLGVGYTIDDLPDLLVTQFVGEQFEKRGSPLTYAVGNESFTAYYGGEGLAIGIRASDPTNWTLQVDFGFGTNQGCLISQLIQDGPPDWVYDDFADTYTITASDPNPLFQGCTLITRVNLCTWHHPFEECNLTETLRGIIFYNDGTLTVNEQLLGPHGWYYDFGQENIARKNDPQSSPEGIYDLGFVSYTVTQ
jgi:hypothetical protein